MNIDTNITKAASMSQGYFESGSGPEEILLLGSCRTVAFLSYLVRWNETIGNNRFTIRRIDPCEWLEQGIAERVQESETDQRILDVLRGSTIFIHEHLEKFGMFNTDPMNDKNIYQFGVNEGNLDITIPNWHDHLILKNDWVAYGAETPPDWIQQGELQVLKFIDVCSWSSFPEFGDTFRDTWRKVRYFWRPNHTSAAFTTAIFRLMVDKFLHLETTNDFCGAIAGEDLFQFPHTEVTHEDVSGYGLEWR